MTWEHRACFSFDRRLIRSYGLKEPVVEGGRYELILTAVLGL